MTSKSLRTTTAIFAALSFLQPHPGFAQSNPVITGGGNGPNTGQAFQLANLITGPFEELCADAMITDALACELYIEDLLAAAEAEAQALTDAAAQASADADAAAEMAIEAEPSVESEAEAEGLARAAAEAEARAASAADSAVRLAAEAEAAAQAAADAEATAQADAMAEAEAQALAQAQAETEAQAQADAMAEAEAQAEADAEAQSIANAEAAAQAEADAAAEAAADAAAEAAADAEAMAEADADAMAEAQAEAEANDAAQAIANAEAAAKAEADAAAQAAANADAMAEADEDETTADVNVPPALSPDVCLAEVLGSDGMIRCVDGITSEDVAAVATETDGEGETEVETEVTTETVGQDANRTSDEEFVEFQRTNNGENADEADDGTAVTAENQSGLSDLEKAGLFILGAVVVGAILSNGQRVEANTGDRVIVVDDDGLYRVWKDDDALLRQPGSEVRTVRFNDGSTQTTVTRTDGTQIITVRDSTGRALRRLRIDPDGRQYLLIDDTRSFEPVVIRNLPRPADNDFGYSAATDSESLRLALLAADRRDLGRSFSLSQVRGYIEVRELAPEINLAAITFATNSAALQASQAEQLRQMGELMLDLIADDPTELFLIEGHTDAIGNAGYNLLLSDRRAESVALAFNEYFGVPTENMIVQGYGERFLSIPTQLAERLNRRVAVRRITTLVR